MRAILVRLHRYLGLATALFLAGRSRRGRVFEACVYPPA